MMLEWNQRAISFPILGAPGRSKELPGAFVCNRRPAGIGRRMFSRFSRIE
jgi:hypothetical protein